MMYVTDAIPGLRDGGVWWKEYVIACDCGAWQTKSVPLTDEGKRTTITCDECGASERLHRIPRETRGVDGG